MAASQLHSGDLAAEMLSQVPVRASTYLRENDWTPLHDLVNEPGGTSDAWRSAAERLGTLLRQSLGLRQSPLQTEILGASVRIRASGIAGTLRLRGLTMDIAPKFISPGTDQASWQNSMFSVLGRAGRSRLAYSRASHLSQAATSFVDHLALAYLDALEAGLATEAIHTYMVREGRLMTLRGRFNLQRQLRAAFDHPHLIECDFDELNTDNTYNHLLHWACGRLVGLVRDSATRSRLLSMGWKLPPVAGPARLPSRFPLPIPPQYRSWTDAVDIASLLAVGKSHAMPRGVLSGYGLVLGMERLFEDFVENSLAHAARLVPLNAVEVRRQDSRLYALPTEEHLRRYFTRPDNVLYVQGKAALVVDAKYKRLADAEETSLRKPTNSDMYQLVASLTAHDCSHGLLVFPKIVGDADLSDGQVRTWHVEAFGKTLTLSAAALDLACLQGAEDLRHLDRRLAKVVTGLIPVGAQPSG
ncbi:MAG: McrC family protein [Candidatus Dormibacteria bacterium]